MTLNDIRLLFNRAISLTFNWKKFFLTSAFLLLCGLLFVFFRGLGLSAGKWIFISLNFVSIFSSLPLLLCLGILLTRIYHDELKQRDYSFRRITFNSWDILIGSSFCSLPFVLAYLFLWIFLGIFILMSEIPKVGLFFASVLAFIPFILNLLSVGLILLAFAILFTVTPVLALKRLDPIYIFRVVLQRLMSDFFSNMLLALVSVIPLAILASLLWLSASLTEFSLSVPEESLLKTVYSFFIMVPSAAVLAPGVILFFNLALESHILLVKTTANSFSKSMDFHDNLVRF
jgi:hypothetical protein